MIPIGAVRLAVLVVTLAVLAPARDVAARPRIGSPAAIVLDAASGDAIWSKDADEARPIASMTKIFVALVLRRHGLDLEGWSTITADDVAASEGGARTRLPEGQTFRNVDLLHAMLMVSDNRAPTALARSVGLDRDALVEAMNALAVELGLPSTSFVDPTGIEDNRSTARELAIALRETLADPVLAKIMKRKHIRIWSKTREVKVEYRNTVKPLHDAIYAVRGGKTGHTEGAGYCLLVAVTIDSRDYVLALLGGRRKHTRFVDFDRLAAWLDRRR